ncbi:MAG: O-antigen ligase family protein [Verrucomicrobiota bacterium]
MSTKPSVEKREETGGLSSILTISILTACIVGMLWLGLFGTAYEMGWQWPSWVAFGVAGVLSVPLALRQSKGRVNRFLLAVTFAMSVYVIWRALLTIPVHRARMDLLLVLGGFVIYALFSTLFTSSKARWPFVLTLLVLGLANAGVAFYQYFVKIDFAFASLLVEGTVRVQHSDSPGGLFNNRNHFAGFMEVVSLLCWSLVIFGRLHITVRILFVLIGMILVLALGLSASRGGFFAFGAGLIVLAFVSTIVWFKIVRRRKLLALLGLIVGLAVVATVALSVFVSTIEKRGKTGATTVDTLTNYSQRLKNWEIAVEQFKLSPVIGTGARTYADYFSKLWPEDLYLNAGHARFTHNDYLQVLAEYGWVGLGIALIFLASHVFTGIRRIFWFCGRDGPSDKIKTSTNLALLVGSLAAIAACAVHSAGDFILHFPTTAVPVAFCFAVCANPGFGLKRRRGDGWTSRVIPRLSAAAAGVSLLALGWRWAPAEWDHLLAEIAIKQERFDESLQHLQNAVEKDPTNPNTWKRLGADRWNQLAEGYPEILNVQYLRSAVDAFETAHMLNPHDYWTMNQLGETWWRLASSPELQMNEAYEALIQAEKWYEKALEWAPMRYFIWRSYAVTLKNRAIDEYLAGNHGKAIELLEASDQAYEKPSRLAVLRGPVRSERAQIQRLLAEFRKAGQDSP